MKSDVMPGPATLPGADGGPARPAASGTGGADGAATRGGGPRAARGAPHAPPLGARGARGALVVLSVPFVFPTWWMATSSLKPMSEILRAVPTLWPQDPSFAAYGEVFRLQPFAQQYWNSLYIAVVVTVGTILVASMAGYAFARIRFPGANALFLLVLVGLLVPSEVTIVPLFRMVNSLGLIDTHWPLVVIPILGAPSVLATFIMRQFFLGLPGELEEAGRMDGLGRWGIFWRIASRCRARRSRPSRSSRSSSRGTCTSSRSCTCPARTGSRSRRRSRSTSTPTAARCGTSSSPRRRSRCCRSSRCSSSRRSSSSRAWRTRD
nr:carbohydrate ABC transporter permease [Cellulosimicrobium sp. MM]